MTTTMAATQQPVPQEARRRRTIVLAVAHAVLAVLILAGFVYVQMHRG